MLDTNFFLSIEVTAYFLYISFKVILLIIFLSASKYYYCVGLELYILI
jgi:hypothetical protein